MYKRQVPLLVIVPLLVSVPAILMVPEDNVLSAAPASMVRLLQLPVVIISGILAADDLMITSTEEVLSLIHI